MHNEKWILSSVYKTHNLKGKIDTAIEESTHIQMGYGLENKTTKLPVSAC